MSVSSKETSFGRQLPPFSFFLLLPRLSRQFQYYCCVEASHCKRDSFLISAATGTWDGSCSLLGRQTQNASLPCHKTINTLRKQRTLQRGLATTQRYPKVRSKMSFRRLIFFVLLDSYRIVSYRRRCFQAFSIFPGSCSPRNLVP